MRVNSQAVCEIEEKRRYLLEFLGFCGGGASLKQHNPPPQTPPFSLLSFASFLCLISGGGLFFYVRNFGRRRGKSGE